MKPGELLRIVNEDSSWPIDRLLLLLEPVDSDIRPVWKALTPAGVCKWYTTRDLERFTQRVQLLEEDDAK